MTKRTSFSAATSHDALSPGLGNLGRLAPELRNVIYDYVLPEHDPIDIFPKSRHELRFKDSGRKIHVSKPWREPGLLKASNAIRKEASAFYYMQNDFSIDIEMHEFGALTEWLSVLVRKFGPRLFRSLHIAIDRPEWKDLHYARSLVRFIHATTFNPAPGLCRSNLCPNHGHNVASKCAELVCAPLAAKEWQIKFALMDLVELAVQGVKKGWDERKMERVLVSCFGKFEKRFASEERSMEWWQEEVRKAVVVGRDDRGRRIMETVGDTSEGGR